MLYGRNVNSKMQSWGFKMKQELTIRSSDSILKFYLYRTTHAKL